MTDGRRISDDEARELWRRATELQAAAERAGEPAEARDGSDLPSGGQVVAHDPSALRAEQVLGAAAEAGISSDHVLFALAERRLADWEAIRPERWTARWLRRVAGEADAVEVSRRVRASPARVRAALTAVAGEAPFDLVAEDRFGEDPADGIVVVFRSPGASTWTPSAFHRALDLADGRVVLATIRAEDDATRLRLRVPLYRRGLNLTLAGGSTAVLGGSGGAVGAVVAEAAAGLVGAAALTATVAVGAVGALAGGGLGLWGYRRLYRWARKKGEIAVQNLAGAVVSAAEAETAVELPRGPAPERDDS